MPTPTSTNPNKTKSLNYISSRKATGCPRIFFNISDPLNPYLSFCANIAYYDDYPKDYSTFEKRLDYLNSVMIDGGCPYTFKVRRTLELANGQQIFLSVSGDHVEGVKAHRATNRSRKNTRVVIKYDHIHQQLTELRKVKEKREIDPTYTHLPGFINRTNFTRATPNQPPDTITTYYTQAARQTCWAYNQIDADQFTPEQSRNLLKYQDLKAIIHQRDERLAEYAIRGLTPQEALVEFKANLAKDECLSEIDRFSNKLKEGYKLSCKANKIVGTDRVLSHSAVKRWSQRVISSGMETSRFLSALKHNFAGNQHPLSYVLDSA